MTELKALHHSLSSEPLFAFSEKHDKKKRNDLTNPQRLLLLSSEMLGLFAHFLGIVENERDIYKNKYLAALGGNLFIIYLLFIFYYPIISNNNNKEKKRKKRKETNDHSYFVLFSLSQIISNLKDL